MSNSGMSSKQLSAFAMDVVYYMEDTGHFLHKRTKKTGKQSCALQISFELLDTALDSKAILRLIHNVWMTAQLGYGDDLIKESINSSSVTFRYKTGSADSGLRATGEIIVVGVS